MVFTPGHSALSMPTCAIRPTMRMAARSARGSIFTRPPIFPTNENRKSKRRAALVNCQKRLRSGSAPRSRIFWTTGANRPSSRRCRPPRNRPIASASPPSSTGRRRVRPRQRCVPRSAPPSCRSRSPHPADRGREQQRQRLRRQQSRQKSACPPKISLGDQR
jgi:hypothetical protein